MFFVLLLISQSQSSKILNSPIRPGRYEKDLDSDQTDCVSATRPQQTFMKSNNFSVDMRMPGVVPAESDTYLCTAFPVPTSRDAYVVDFIPHANMKTVHHMILFGCRTPVSTSSYWDCGSVQGTCKDEASIMYAWARNAPPTILPKDVGFKVGRNSGISHFVMQIHYGDISAFRDHHRDCSGMTLRMTFTPQPFIAGIFLLMSVDTVIHPGKTVTNADVACDYSSYPIYPFAFRTHTHRLGKVVSGYRIRDGKWSLIGRQSPQLPQAFYPSTKDLTIRYGDTVAARCVFTGEGRTSEVYIGGTSDDEMCNFYIMYYMEHRHVVPFMNCMEAGEPELFQNIPAEANVPIPVSAGHLHSPMHMGHPADSHYEQVLDWPQTPLLLGQLSGLALDSDSNLVIFHRGDRHWGAASFDNKARYQQRFLGPIQQSTILVVEPSTGNVLKASGRNMFYLPHGITTDTSNNYWVTDVALHQVLKVSSDGRDSALLTLGEAFTPGSDRSHFCQPTDVAVDPTTGDVFVSDGYCNSRILRFSSAGSYLSEWGAGSSDRRRRVPFAVPHSLVFLPDRREVCVADRENGRIQCFLAESQEFVKEIKKKEFGGRVFAISYRPGGDGLIFAVNGVSRDYSSLLTGFVINYSTKEILDTFYPETKEFAMPHDIVQSGDGAIFVGDATNKYVYKFTTEKSHHSVKKAGIEELKEIEMFVQTKGRTRHNVTAAEVTEKQQQLPEQQQQQTQTQSQEEKMKMSAVPDRGRQGALPTIITVLLLSPLVVLLSVGLYLCRRNSDQRNAKSEPSSVEGILGKIRGRAVGGLNLGNFLASRQGYSQQGFDQLSTEGSDQERNQDDSSDSDNDDYFAPDRSSS